MDKQQLQTLVNQIYAAHAEDMDCDSCQQELDCLAELTLVGYECGDILPAVQKHMNCCGHCRELFKGLVVVLKAQQAGEV